MNGECRRSVTCCKQLIFTYKSEKNCSNLSVKYVVLKHLLLLHFPTNAALTESAVFVPQTENREEIIPLSNPTSASVIWKIYLKN